jgi:hypothetical protein
MASKGKNKQKAENESGDVKADTKPLGIRDFPASEYLFPREPDALPTETPTEPTQVMRPEKGEPCTDHAGMTENFCLKCGMPLQDVKSDGFKPYPVTVAEPWSTRLLSLAKQADMTPNAYVVLLIRKQWIASGAGKRAT